MATQSVKKSKVSKTSNAKATPVNIAGAKGKKIDRLNEEASPNTINLPHLSSTDLCGTCHHCHEAKKSYRRVFSEKAWTVLLVWEEIQQEEVGEPMCNSCYDELREVLIDRADEIDPALAHAKNPPRLQHLLSKLAS